MSHDRDRRRDVVGDKSHVVGARRVVGARNLGTVLLIGLFDRDEGCPFSRGLGGSGEEEEELIRMSQDSAQRQVYSKK